jgi:hypothetical protein
MFIKHKYIHTQMHTGQICGLAGRGQTMLQGKEKGTRATHTHTHTNADTHFHTRTYTHKHTHTHTHTHKHPHTDTHTHTLRYRYTQRARARANTHTHTHTHEHLEIDVSNLVRLCLNDAQRGYVVTRNHYAPASYCLWLSYMYMYISLFTLCGLGITEMSSVSGWGLKLLVFEALLSY